VSQCLNHLLIFDTAANLLLTQRRKVRTTVFRRQNSTLRKRFFLKLGCVPVSRFLIRILRASLVQIDTEMTNKYSNQRYAVYMM